MERDQAAVKSGDLSYALAQSDLGWVLVAASSRGIRAIDIGDSPEALEAGLRDRFPQSRRMQDDPELTAAVGQVLNLLDAPASRPDLALDLQGSEFQLRVWRALLDIPAGTTISYSELASALGQPSAVRAVAHACASNMIAVAIPCHRVRRADGTLAGYRWGLERKQQLLEREKGYSFLKEEIALS